MDNWYKLTKESMPLPRATYPEEGERNYDDFYKRVMDQQLPDYPEQDPEGDLNYLGSGIGGMAFESGNSADKVVKFTFDKEEFEAAQALMQWQKQHGSFHPCAVGVYEASQVSKGSGEAGGPDGVYRLVTERVRDVREYGDRADKLISWILRLPSSYWTDREKLIGGMSEFYRKYDVANPKEKEIYEMVANKHLDLLDKMNRMGVKHHDLHGGNVGIREDGTFVALDLGGMFL